MTSVSTDSLGRSYLRGPNGQFTRPKTDEERKMIEKAKKQSAKENKSKVSGILRTEPAGKKKLNNKRESSKFAASHGSKLSTKREHSTSKRFATSDSKALTRSNSLSVTNDDNGYGSLRSKSKRRFSVAKRKPLIRSNSASEVSQSLQTKSAFAPKRNVRFAKSNKKPMSEDQSFQTQSVSALLKRNVRLAKSGKKSVSEDQSFQTMSIYAPRHSNRLVAAKASLSKTPVKRVQSKNVKSRSSSTKRKPSIRSITDENQNIRSKSNAAPKCNVCFAGLSNKRRSSSIKRKSSIRSDSVSEETQSTQSKSIDAPKRNARLAQLEKSRGSKSSAKHGQFEAAKLLSFSDSVSDGESNSPPQANLAVAPRRSARLAAKARK